jgi:hypothetical protein
MPMAYRSAPKQSSGSILEPYVPYIHRRWAEACHNALLQLWRAIKKKGYSGQGGRSPQVLKASAPQVGTTDARAARHFSGCENHLRASRLQARGVVAAEAEGGSFSRTTNVCGAVVPPVSRSEKDTGDGARLSEESFGGGNLEHSIVGMRLLKAARRPSLKVLLRVSSRTTKQLERRSPTNGATG